MESGDTRSVLEMVKTQVRSVVDPCSLRAAQPLDVMSMGLIEDLSVRGREVSMRLLLTEPMCIFGKDIMDAIETAVMKLDFVDRVHIDIDTENIWTPERMAPAAKTLFWPTSPPMSPPTSPPPPEA